MEGSKLLAMIVTVTVGIIFVGALLGPVINGYSETEKTFTNEGLFYLEKYNSDSEIPTIVWEYTKPTQVTVGDDVVTLSDTTIPQSIIFGTDWAVRYDVESASLTYSQLFGGVNGIIVSATTQNQKDMTISFSAGTATITNGTDTSTQSYDDVYCIAKSGPYVMKNPNSSSYLNGDSEVGVVGRTILSGWATPLNIFFSGNISDGFNADIIFPTTGYTIDNYVEDYSSVNGYLDLYSLSNVKFDITNGEDVTKTATYSQFVVPYQVTAEMSQHLDAGEIALLAVLPLMAITALLLLAVRFFTGRD